jgi:hypothetical protein
MQPFVILVVQCMCRIYNKLLIRKIPIFKASKLCINVGNIRFGVEKFSITDFLASKILCNNKVTVTFCLSWSIENENSDLSKILAILSIQKKVPTSHPLPFSWIQDKFHDWAFTRIVVSSMINLHLLNLYDWTPRRHQNLRESRKASRKRWGNKKIELVHE